MNTTRLSGERVLHLVVPAKAEYLSLVRLVVASVASSAGFSEENIADIKVALSEASTNVVRHAYPVDCDHRNRIIEVNCYEEPSRLTIEILDQGSGMHLPPPASEGLGLGIMGSLMDKVDVETGNSGTSVLLIKTPSLTRSQASS